MKVLVACEESQTVCKAFRAKGHEAYSCDIQEPSGGRPEWHILGDALKILSPVFIEDVVPEDRCYGIEFCTMDKQYHFIDHWDLLIAHPPCTYLSNAGACRLYKVIDGKTYIERERFEKGLDGKDFFMEFFNAECEHIAIENPVPSAVYRMPPYTQTIQPYEYGEPYSKKTCLWLKGLQELVPTKVLTEYKPYVSCGTSHNKGNKDKAGVSRSGGAAKVRSKTFTGIAQAMADQWGDEQ
jgi:hypothetical protein